MQQFQTAVCRLAVQSNLSGGTQMQQISRQFRAARLRLLVIWMLALFVSVRTAPVEAQTDGTGSIAGTVTDSLGSVVAGATVAAVNNLTAVKTVAISTGTGRFVISLLQPGTYTVTVTAVTFETLTQENVTVDALQSIAFDPKLTVGSASSSVTVTDQPPMLQVDDVKLGSTIDNETYDSLPLAMNQSASDPSAFIGLAVGVNSFSVQAAGPSTASFNGGQTYQNETYVEGLAYDQRRHGERYAQSCLRRLRGSGGSVPGCHRRALRRCMKGRVSRTSSSSPAPTSSTAESTSTSATPSSTPRSSSPLVPDRAPE